MDRMKNRTPQSGFSFKKRTPDAEAEADTNQQQDDTLVNQVVAKRYRCLSVIGSGGMGIVYLAEDKVLKRRVVLKMLLQTPHNKDKNTSRFMREATLLSQLNHPHIVTIHDFGSWKQNMFIVLEYLRGENLQDILHGYGALSTVRIKHILQQILDALEAAHHAGIIHRDLKPSNVFCTPDLESDYPEENEFVKILDFGTAISIDTDVSEKITTTGEVIGTPHYMAPEQIMGEKVFSPSTDIYSLGIILYEMLTGVPPFDSDNKMTILLGHLYKAPPAIDLAAYEGDEQRSALAKAVDVCLNKNPDERYRDIHELRQAISGETKKKGRLVENLTDDRQVRYRQFYQGPVKATRLFTADTLSDIPNEIAGENLSLLVLEPGELAIEKSVTPLLRLTAYTITTLFELDQEILDILDRSHLVILNSDKAGNLELIETIKKNEKWSDIPILVCGPEDDLDYISKAIEAGAADYISLPFEPKEVIKKIEDHVRL